MRRLMFSILLLVFGAGAIGCSEETQQDTREAIDAGSEAIEGAAEDAGQATEGAVEGAKEAVDDESSD